MKAKKILFITQEMTPYVPDSELATFGRYLPQHIQEKGREIRTFMPKWGNINKRRNQLHEVIRLSGMNIIIDDTDHPLIIMVASIPSNPRMQVYFIDNDDYFTNRQMACNEEGIEYDDNDERAVFYARGVLETVKKWGWAPDIIHCQGWMSALVPMYVKKAYQDEPCFKNSKVVFSLTDDKFSKDIRENLKNSIAYRAIEGSILDKYNQNFSFEELSKLALDYSDGFTTNHPEDHAILVEYAKGLGIPVLLGKTENDTEEFSNLYDLIWDQDNNEDGEE